MGYLNGGGAHGTGKTIAGFAARAHAAWPPTIKKNSFVTCHALAGNTTALKHAEATYYPRPNRMVPLSVLEVLSVPRNP